MSENPYAPPTARLIDPQSPASAEAPFFAVSLLKLTVLGLCTLGIYDLYWFYRNWKRVKARNEPDILPFWRAFFAVFYCYPCFTRIREAGSEQGIAPTLPAGALAVGWILTRITYRLPDPYWLISLFAVLFLLPVQAYANRINVAAEPTHDPNSRFSAWNWLGIIVGGILLILAVIATVLPETLAPN